MAQHWTDNAPSPVFATEIPIGNTVEMVGIAGGMLRRMRIPKDRITALYSAVLEADSYEDAIAAIERWFPVKRDGEKP